MNWQPRGSGFDLVRGGAVLARVRWDGKERWYAVARDGDFSLDTKKHPSKSADAAKDVAVRWLRERALL